MSIIDDQRGMARLRAVLCKEIHDNSRTRRYQAIVDQGIDETLEAIRKGQPGGMAIGGTAMAVSYRNPSSKFFGSEEMVRHGLETVRAFAHTQNTADLSTFDSWGHEWAIGDGINAFVLLEEMVDSELKEELLTGCRRAAEVFIDRSRFGTVGNQSIAGCMGDLLYGLLLENDEYVDLAQARFEETAPRILMESGQVNEQYGPCPNYSSGALTGVVSYVDLAGRTDFDERITKALQWFRYMHTNSLTVFPGPSTRKHYSEDMQHIPLHLLGVMEREAGKNPMFARMRDRFEQRFDNAVPWHTYSATLQSMCACQGEIEEPTKEQIAQWNAPYEEFFEQTWYGRGPIKYALVRRTYQTAISFTGWLPLMGLQTWAYGDEPPIIHPLHDMPSCTQAWGIDTARFSCSHLHYSLGPGCMAADVAWRSDGSSREGLEDEPAFVVWRNHTLRTVAIFTDVSTVMIQLGEAGRRETRWTLNPLHPAKVALGDGVVTFEGRQGRIYYLAAPPELKVQRVGIDRRDYGRLPATEIDVETLEFEIEDGGAAVFAFSDESFAFGRNNLDDSGILEFTDSSGSFHADISTISDERGRLTYGLDTAKIKGRL